MQFAPLLAARKKLVARSLPRPGSVAGPYLDKSGCTRIDEHVRATQKTPRRVEETRLIRHIVFFSAKRKEDIEAVRTGLLALAAIPHSSHFEVTVNTKVDPLCDAIDLVVYAEFADEAALAAYKAHPIYDETTRKVRPMRELRFSADVVADQGS